jgi:hypothetical protein
LEPQPVMANATAVTAITVLILVFILVFIRVFIRPSRLPVRDGMAPPTGCGCIA